MLLRHFLLLLLFIHVSHSNRVLDKLKNVQKRFSILGYYFFENDPQETIADWNAKTEEQRNELRWKTTRWVGGYFVNHLQNAKRFSDEYYSKILDLRAPNMTAKICDLEKTLTSYQFAEHMKRTRKTFVFTHPEERNVSYTLLPSNDNLTFSFIVRFQTKTVFEFTSQIVYKVEMKLILYQYEEIHHSQFLITHVHIYGDCAENGNIDYEQSLYLTKSNKDMWKNDSQAERLLRKFTLDPRNTDYGGDNDIPSSWLEDSLMVDEDVQIFTCQQGTQTHKLEHFKYWWSKFSLMWQPKVFDVNFIKLQMIKYDEDVDLVARLTFRLQSGRWIKTVTHDWDLKVRALFNTKGDYRWYIQMIQVQCPPGLDIQKEYYNAMGEVMGAELSHMVDWGLPWAATFVQYFKGFTNMTKHPYHLTYCGEKFDNPDNFYLLDKRFADRHGHEYTQIYAYEKELTGFDPGEVCTMTAYIYIHDKDKSRLKFNIRTEWTFTLKWDTKDQFYYITEVDLGCTKLANYFCPPTKCMRIG